MISSYQRTDLHYYIRIYIEFWISLWHFPKVADIPVQMQGVIIASCILYNATWPEIESVTSVKQNTARHLITTLVERAGNWDLNDLFEQAAPLYRRL